jgi:hypothetical protein
MGGAFLTIPAPGYPAERRQQQTMRSRITGIAAEKPIWPD